MDNTESDGHILRRWVSVGDVIVLVTSLLAIGITYGRLATIVTQLQEEVREMHDSGTPEARMQIARLEAIVSSNSSQIQQLRQESREGRQEVLTALRSVDEKLERHMTK